MMQAVKIMEEVAAKVEKSSWRANVSGRLQHNSQSGRRGIIVIKQFFTCLVMAGMAYGWFQFSQSYVLQTVQVTGPSMSPTLPDSNRYLLNHLSYLYREPKPADIVVLRDPQDNGYAIKRIIANPGDSVYVKGGQVFVNGKALDEPYLKPGTKTYAAPRYTSEFWVCGVNQYFVLGDNRNNSADSRLYGTVSRENILGKVSP